MVGDTEARNAVRELVKRLELIAAQGGAMAYVLVKRDPKEYARLLEAAEVAMRTVIQPISEADRDFSAVYAALDNPSADWSKAAVAMLNRGAIEFTGEQAMERFKFMQSLEERFDAEMKKRKKSGEGPGIGNRG